MNKGHAWRQWLVAVVLAALAILGNTSLAQAGDHVRSTELRRSSISYVDSLLERSEWNGVRKWVYPAAPARASTTRRYERNWVWHGWELDSTTPDISPRRYERNWSWHGYVPSVPEPFDTTPRRYEHNWTAYWD